MCENVVINWIEDIVADIVNPFQCLLNKIKAVNPEVERRLRDVIAPKKCAHWDNLIRDLVKEKFEHKYDRDFWRSLVGMLNSDGSKKNSVIIAALYWYLVHRFSGDSLKDIPKDVRHACECRFSENCLFHDAYCKLTVSLNIAV